MTRAEPFDMGDEESRAELTTRLKTIIDQNRAVSSQLTSHLTEAHVTTRMLEVRALPLADRRHVYASERIDDQLRWYSSKAAAAERNSKLFFLFVVLTNAIAVAFALLRIKFPGAPYWPTDVFVAGSACLLSWMQARRFSELSSSYALTAHEISFIKMSANAPSSDDGLSKFVGDTENAFSREHTQWIARKDEA